MSTGVVSLSKIKNKFHHEVIVEFLIHLEFCFRIIDQHQGRIQDFLKGGAGLVGLLRNLQSQGRSHTPPR